MSVYLLLRYPIGDDIPAYQIIFEQIASGFLYFKKKEDKTAMKLCKDYARMLRKTDMESFWLFIYEALPQSDLGDYWKAMKKKHVTFLMNI